MQVSSVKVFGERNTGTNVLSQLVEANSSSKCLPGTEPEIDRKGWQRAQAPWIIGKRMREWCFDRVFAGQNALHSWKHCATNFEDIAIFDRTLVLITVRHPASWLISLFRNPYQCLGTIPESLAEFVEFRWKTTGRERLGRRTFTPLQLYQAKIDSYLSFTDQLSRFDIAHHFVRFEDIVADQKSTFDAISNDLLMPHQDFEPVQSSTKDKGLFRKAAERRALASDGPASKDLDYYRAYYGEERWRERLAGLEAAINGRVDWDRLDRFGYAPL
jgi:hypothetical protein